MPRRELTYPNEPPATAGRYAARVTHALRTIHNIINTALLLQISYRATEDNPYSTMVPMIGQMGSFARPSADEGDVLHLYLHTHAQHTLARLVRNHLNKDQSNEQDGSSSDKKVQGFPLTIAASHVDGIVLTMTPFSHTVNHRSAVLYGRAQEVTDTEEKNWAMKLIVDGVVRDQWDRTRAPSQAEITSTAVLRVQIETGSAKIRQGGPGEERVDLQNEDLRRSVWTGVVPLRTVMDSPVKGPACLVDDVPKDLEAWRTALNSEREDIAKEMLEEASKNKPADDEE